MSKLENLKKQYEKLGKEIEKLEKENKYKIVKWCDLEWYVIKENNEGKTLFLKDKFSPEQMEEYFDNEMLDSDKDIRFNYSLKNIWWSDSPIRMVLNSKFLDELNKNEMNLMTTTVSVEDEEKTTEDYVRLITKEEVENLSKDILKSSYKYGYWTMSPSNFGDWSYAHEFDVNTTGALDVNFVSNGYGVRPVVSLKPDVNVQTV